MAVSRDFCRFFVHESNPPGPIIFGLVLLKNSFLRRYSRVWFMKKGKKNIETASFNKNCFRLGNEGKKNILVNKHNENSIKANGLSLLLLYHLIFGGTSPVRKLRCRFNRIGFLRAFVSGVLIPGCTLLYSFTAKNSKFVLYCI